MDEILFCLFFYAFNFEFFGQSFMVTTIATFTATILASVIYTMLIATIRWYKSILSKLQFKYFSPFSTEEYSDIFLMPPILTLCLALEISSFTFWLCLFIFLIWSFVRYEMFQHTSPFPKCPKLTMQLCPLKRNLIHMQGQWLRKGANFSPSYQTFARV